MGLASSRSRAGASPARPVAVLTVGKELQVLDGKRAAVLVYGADGNVLREYASGQAPTDMVLASDGTAFIADQEAGGVLIYEANGVFRLRLGRPGKGNDSFTGLTQLALSRNGELLCLDAAQAQVQRFDRFHRRLPTWQLQHDAKNPAVDIAAHAKGTLFARQWSGVGRRCKRPDFTVVEGPW